MQREQHSVSLICGTQKTGPEKIDESYRGRVMAEFRGGVTRVLLATDVLARGIDVPAVTLVVNYELPRSSDNWSRREPEPDYETYIHRIGRTGRFGLRGVAVNLVTPNERRALESIQSYYRSKIEQLSGDVEEIETMLKNLR